MELNEIMQYLQEKGSAQTLKTFARHGAPMSNIYGVKVGDLKPLVKKIKKNHELSMALFQTGNSDAMYLAGLIADETKISKSELIKWAEQAPWSMISDYTVAWVAAESAYGWELGQDWIKNEKENIQCSGWNTLSNWIALKDDTELDLHEIEKLLVEIGEKIYQASNRTKYAMNNFIIAVGSYILPLSSKAIEIAGKMGEVNVNMGDTSCKVPDAKQYIKKVIDAGKLGKKKKQARC